jgi:hypothetical protein
VAFGGAALAHHHDRPPRDAPHQNWGDCQPGAWSSARSTDRVVKRPIIRERVIVRPIILVDPFVQCAAFFDEDGHQPAGRHDRHDPLFGACAVLFGFDRMSDVTVRHDQVKPMADQLPEAPGTSPTWGPDVM